MRPARFALAILAAVAVAPAARAVIGTPDNVPAATLLLPYFEVDTTATVDQTAGVGGTPSEKLTTIFQVRNHDTAPHLAHVTLWTDYGIPSRSFDLYLTGGDVQDVDLRLAFAGVLPQTGPGISPLGSRSAAHVSFTGCPAILNPTRYDAATIAGLRAAHRGVPSSLFGGKCVGSTRGDNVARGYVTIDVTRACTGTFPGDSGYFVDGGTGVATDDNVLSGEYSITNGASNSAFGDRLVGMEASTSSALTTGGAYTFYSGVAGGSADNREALPARYAARYAAGGATTGTDFLVWRDARAKVLPAATPSQSCTSVPAPWPQQTREVLVFDEQSHPARVSELRPTLQLAAQRAHVGPAAPLDGVLTLSNFGWANIDLDAPDGTTGAPDLRRQGWIVSVQHSEGRYDSGQSATALDPSSRLPLYCLSCGAPGVPVIGAPPTRPNLRAPHTASSTKEKRHKSAATATEQRP